MKIQFVICGWHMDQDSLIDGLKLLQRPIGMNLGSYDRVEIDVFWSCHRTPPDRIKDNFNCKEFYNGAEECGAYQQAVDYLDLDDDTYCFFMHDDLVIRSWEFVGACINLLNQDFKLVGNGFNPGFESYDPFYVTEYGIKPEFDGKMGVDYVKDENKHLFEGKMKVEMARASFWSLQYETVKAIGGFEPREECYVSPMVDEGGNAYYRGSEHLTNTRYGGLSVFGNLFPNLTVYKVNKVFGLNSITWLDKQYRNSMYIHECARGEEG